MYKSWNPALKADVFKGYSVTDETQVMTLEWTTKKSYILLWLVFLGAVLTWYYQALVFPFIIPLVIVTLVLWIVISFKKTTAPYLAPLYAFLEWFVLWTISLYFEVSYPWIILQAVSLTFWVFLAMLLLYQSKIIQPTENFKLWVAAATGWIFLVYLVTFFLNLFWVNVWYIHDAWWIVWILISLVIVVIAALNLVIDFDFIETGVEEKAPKFMEWYWAFWLMVTLIWLYIEILRLLSKMRD
jgi:uncharacterized YccA/Bax inhibitor family protein